MTINAYLTQPAFDRLWADARERWERNGGPRGTARVPELTDAEAAALDGLLDPERRRRTPAIGGGTFTIALAQLDERLQAGPGVSLREVLEHAGGPLRDRPAERAAADRDTAQLWERAAAHPAATKPAVNEWLDSLRRHGTLTRAVSGPAEVRWRVLDGALTVLAALPLDGVELSRLASETLGDTHALDWGTPTGNLTAAGVAASHGRQRPATAAAWRAAWARAGVLCDALSCTVLTYGLQPVDEHEIATAARAMNAIGEPHVLTLRALSRRPLHVEPRTVYVCENPAVISYAAERELRDITLVCSSGWPNTAVARLLRRLSDAGCVLRAQGDFDWDGVRIHRHLVHAHGAASWRFDVATYRAGAARAHNDDPRRLDDDRVSLGSPLAHAMAVAGVAVYEEDICDLLELDLIRCSPRAAPHPS